jgi:hypothetical protein
MLANLPVLEIEHRLLWSVDLDLQIAVVIIHIFFFLVFNIGIKML